jgi:predicted nucleic acid-binding protein
MRADAILIDEARGRRAAVSLGLHPIGVLGVLLQAKRRGLVPRLGPLLDQLQMTIAFRLSPDLRAEALRLAGE